MTYKDRTFCVFDDCSEWDTCPRALTEEVKQAAGDWWERAGGDRKDAPLSLYADKPKCFLPVYVGCSQCGGDFPRRKAGHLGFSHCEDHREGG